MGAWIETLMVMIISSMSLVAPHVGAWIETYLTTVCVTYQKVAPHVGAWIETGSLSATRQSA